MTEDEIVVLVRDELPGTAVVVASEVTGAPEVAWGSTFFFYDPDGDERRRRFPFATSSLPTCQGSTSRPSSPVMASSG